MGRSDSGAPPCGAPSVSMHLDGPAASLALVSCLRSHGPSRPSSLLALNGRIYSRMRGLSRGRDVPDSVSTTVPEGRGLLAVFLECRSTLMRLVGGIVNRHDVDDILQEAFTRSYEASGRTAIRNPRAPIRPPMTPVTTRGSPIIRPHTRMRLRKNSIGPARQRASRPFWTGIAPVRCRRQRTARTTASFMATGGTTTIEVRRIPRAAMMGAEESNERSTAAIHDRGIGERGDHFKCSRAKEDINAR